MNAQPSISLARFLTHVMLVDAACVQICNYFSRSIYEDRPLEMPLIDRSAGNILQV